MRPASVEVDKFRKITAASRGATKQGLSVYFLVSFFFPEFGQATARLLLFYHFVSVELNTPRSPIIILVVLEYLLPSKGKGGGI